MSLLFPQAFLFLLLRVSSHARDSLLPVWGISESQNLSLELRRQILLSKDVQTRARCYTGLRKRNVCDLMM